MFVEIIHTGLAEFERYRQSLIRDINKKISNRLLWREPYCLMTFTSEIIIPQCCFSAYGNPEGNGALGYVQYSNLSEGYTVTKRSLENSIKFFAGIMTL